MALVCFETLTKPPSITGEASLCSTHCGNQFNLLLQEIRLAIMSGPSSFVIRGCLLLVVVLSTGAGLVDDGIY